MSSTEGSLDVSGLEVVHENYSRVFAEGKALRPEHRHLLLSRILRWSGLVPIATTKEKVEEELDVLVGARGLARINDLLDDPEVVRITKSLVEDCGVTYLVASYWSPVDRYRRTVGMRKDDEERTDPKADIAAFLFFLLTFLAGEGDEQLTSIVQFLSTKARRKHGISTDFSDGDDAALGVTRWLRIPADVADQLLDDLGVNSAVEVLGEAYDHRTLQEGLQDLLRKELRHGANLGHAVVERLLRRLLDRAPLSKGGVETVLEGAEVALSECFGEPVTRLQARFMVTTQALWRRACHCDFMYTFPVPTFANHTCCVLTAGTGSGQDGTLNGRLEESAPAHLALSFIARCLFTDPLLIDYARLEQRVLKADLAHEQAHILEPLFRAIEVIERVKVQPGGSGRGCKLVWPPGRVGLEAWPSLQRELRNAGMYLRFLQGAYGGFDDDYDLFDGPGTLTVEEALRHLAREGAAIGVQKSGASEVINLERCERVTESLCEAVKVGFSQWKDGAGSARFWRLRPGERERRFGVCAVMLCIFINTSQHLARRFDKVRPDAEPLVTIALKKDSERIDNWAPVEGAAGVDRDRDGNRRRGTAEVLGSLLRDDRFGWTKAGEVVEFGRGEDERFVVEATLPGGFWSVHRW